MLKAKSITPPIAPALPGDTATSVTVAKAGSQRLYRLALVLPILLFAGVTNAQYQQYPIMEGIATRVIQKYQQSTCDQLWQQRGQPKSEREQQAVQMLRDDPQMRAAFINRIAAPIANKMFECGLLP
jgi:hypothetical protein